MDDTLADPIAGRLIDGRYAVTARIAHGGMATVYLATDTRLDRRVALKVMHAELARDDDFVRRFIDEAKSVARLSHQNVVAVYDQGADGPFLYLAMEYVPGRTLKDVLAEHGRFSPAAALDIISGVLDGLAAAHASGIVHRDVKPENVLITPGGGIKVADFGLARAHAAAGHTRSGMIIGTVAYLSPEQVTGTAPTGPRSDVYSVGVMLYELLTGHKPFTGESPIAVAYQHVNQDVPAPSGLLPEMPAAVDELVRAATDRDPARRPADAAQFLRMVRQVQEMGEHSGLTGLIGVGVQGLTEAPWLGSQASGATLPPGGPNGNHTLIVRREEADRYLAGGGDPFLGRWLFSRRLVIVALGLAILIGVGLGGWWIISGQYATIPSVAGDTVSEATAVLVSQGFQVSSGTQQENSNTVSTGQVAGTSPSGRTSKGAKITILVSAGPFTAMVPDVRGETQATALAKLRRANLIVQVQRVGSNSPIGTVLGTNPAAGTTWPETKTVFLRVAGGPPLPKFIGLQESAARRLALQHGITLNATLDNNGNQPQGTVTAQSPGPDSIMQQGETVTITVSNGPALIRVPYVFGESVDQARLQLKAAGFNVQVSSLGFFGQVFDTDPTPGTMAPRGSTVIIYANLVGGGGNGNGGGGGGGGGNGGGGGIFGGSL